ncbi:MAG: 50S ribosomal protein P1 [ANME-2 cluster archaeon]|jgi:large subunit ribosomal protein L12|nr:50S ribosomal protein P1 [ANME-2 cluster archaeon]MBC2702295.1 50S ribosomal protein P1 [ANME-2 cluster archaeon]MBC2708516.1 50S ribosomal protein P1 [ANME-2 cluster archaeon]MBC2748446.1 50S ribosomal protein P1 [ANME-2 cluster archaeon]MBC2761939.1 50S ribosomal protein P1 [ANME-2 cluster archaeon]
MEYVYAALLLHNAGKDVTEDAITGILQAADVDVDATRVKALVASLEGVDIQEAIEKAAFAAPAAGAAAGAPAAVAEEAPAAAEEAAAEEEEEAEESGMEGLGALFG